MWDMLRRVLVLLLLILASGEARANYTEAHAAGVDVRAVIERDGRMTVTHVVAYRVVAGTLRSIALSGFEDDLRFRPTAAVTSSDGRTLGASVTRDDKDVLHVTVDDPKGLKRGDYRFELVYEGSLVGRRLTRDGAFERVRFALPPMREPIDGARVVLELPSAPTEPRAITDGDMAADSTNLRRTAERDELELVRPHVPKGDAATFFARVDPKALALVSDPALRAAPPMPAMDAAPERPPIGVALVVAACALALFAAALAKSRVLPPEAYGLVPLPSSVRAALAGALFGAGVLVETQGRFTLGAALVAAAMPLSAWRIAARPRGVRAPSPWLATKPEDAFGVARSPADFLDATTRRGALVLAAFVALVAVACHLARAAGGAAPYLLAIDALAFVPTFFTGTSRQMPASAAREGAALAPLARALEGEEDLDVAPFARDDEMRLFVTPRLAMPGASGIEIGVAWDRAGGALLASFDVLVRVHDGSFASAKMTSAYPTKRPLPGRKVEERVFRFEPEGPSVYAAASLVRDLAAVLRDRRVVGAAEGGTAQSRPVVLAEGFDGVDRRLPPNARKTARSLA